MLDGPLSELHINDLQDCKQPWRKTLLFGPLIFIDEDHSRWFNEISEKSMYLAQKFKPHVRRRARLL